MAHRGLQARMVLAMSVLFGFYALFTVLFAPVFGWGLIIACSVFVLAIARYREYVDDAVASTGDPDALAIIHEVGTHEQAPRPDTGTAAMCLFGGRSGPLASLFARHPPMEKRIERLQSR